MPVHITGRLICRDEAEARIVRSHIAEHIRLTRAEPGCIAFDVVPALNDPLVWMLDESFRDAAAFEAHRIRIAASEWGRVSRGITRDFRVTEKP